MKNEKKKVIGNFLFNKAQKSWFVLKKFSAQIIKQPSLIKRFFSLLFKHGPSGTMQNAYDFLQLQKSWVSQSDAQTKELEKSFYVHHKINSNDLVSIIIPTKDKSELLEKCVNSILNKTTYKNYEIIIVNNNSRKRKTKECFNNLLKKSDRIKIFDYNKIFNFSAINNYAAALANGNIFLFLNNDTEVINDDWLEALVEQVQRPEVGAVGCKLLYPNRTIQHAGIIFDKTIKGLVRHVFCGQEDNSSYLKFNRIRNYSAVTGACLIVRRDVFYEVGGFDDKYKITFSDIDICFKLRQKGNLVVYTPLSRLYHFESATRGLDINTKDLLLFQNKWKGVLEKGDPYNI